MICSFLLWVCLFIFGGVVVGGRVIYGCCGGWFYCYLSRLCRFLCVVGWILWKCLLLKWFEGGF